MHEGQATAPRGTVAEVSHEARASKRQVALSISSVGELLLRDVGEGGVDRVEDLLDGRSPLSTLTEEIFVARRTMELDDC